MIGGAVTFVNPEPLALFADVIAAGEGEVLVPSLVRAFEAASDRGELLRLLAAERGYYVPSFYDLHYNADNTISRFAPRPGTGAPAVVRMDAVATDGGGNRQRSLRVAAYFLDQGRAAAVGVLVSLHEGTEGQYLPCTATVVESVRLSASGSVAR